MCEAINLLNYRNISYLLVALVIGKEPPSGIHKQSDWIIEDIETLAKRDVLSLQFFFRPKVENRVFLSTFYGLDCSKAEFIVNAIETLSDHRFHDPMKDLGHQNGFYFWPKAWGIPYYLSVPYFHGCLTWTEKMNPDEVLHCIEIRFRNYNLQIGKHYMSYDNGLSKTPANVVAKIVSPWVTGAGLAAEAYDAKLELPFRNIKKGKEQPHEFVIFKVFEKDDEFYLLSKVGRPKWFAVMDLGWMGGNPLIERGLKFSEGDPGEQGYWKWKPK